MTTIRRKFYSRAWVNRDGGVAGMQDGGPVPFDGLVNAAHGITSWATGDAADPFGTMLFQETQTVFTAAHVFTPPAAINCFRVPKVITGSFTGGSWDFSASVIAGQAAGTVSGRMHFNLWRSANPRGVGAVRLNVPDITGSEVTGLTTEESQESVGSAALASFDLYEEFLFLVMEWEATTPGDPGDTVQLRLGELTNMLSSHFTLPDGAPIPQYLEVDWGGSGFDSSQDPDVNAHSDISIYARGATSSRGLSYDAQALPKNEVGRLSSTLQNPQGIYARQNPDSPLYGSITSKLAVRARMTAPIDTLYFAGQIDSLTPQANPSEDPTANFAALTDFIEFADNSKVTPEIVAGATTDVAYGAVLDQVVIRGVKGWPESRRRISTGDVTVGVISPEDESPEQIIDRITQNELGRVYPAANGDFVAENRNYRRDTERCQEVQLTFSDDPDLVDGESNFYASIKLEDQSRLHYDRVAVDFTPTFQLDTEPVWLFGVVKDGLGETGGIHIAPGATRSFTIFPFDYPNIYPTESGHTDSSSVGPMGSYVVTEWEPLTTHESLPHLASIYVEDQPGIYAGIDSASLNLVKTTPRSIIFTVTNADPDLFMIVTEVLIEGKRAVVGAPVKQIVGTGTHEYPVPGKDYPDSTSSLLAARWLFDYLSPDRDWITLVIPCAGNPELLVKLMQLEISSRIRGIGTKGRTGMGMDQEFFVENIKWSLQAPGHFMATVLASGCLPNTQDTVTVETGLPTGLSIYYGMNESSGDVKDFQDTHYDLDRIGTEVNIGIIGPGQEFEEVEANQLVNTTHGLPDDHLTNDWEWNGFVKPNTHTGGDQIILQKGIGDPPSYGLQLQSLSGNQYLQGLIYTSDGVFKTVSNGIPLSHDSWHFVRLIHDSVGKRIGISQDNLAILWADYTGTIQVVSDGIIFGSSGTLSANGFEYWYLATDLTDPAGSDVNLWPDRSGNGRDADTRGGTDVKIVDAVMNGKRIVRFNNGHLRFPEMGLGPVQIFILVNVRSQTFQGTFLRTSGTPGPNYGLGLNNNFGTYELSVHYYSHNNDDPVKFHTVVTTPPLGWAVYTLLDDGTGGAMDLHINGVSQTLAPNGAFYTSAQGINPDNADEVDVFSIIIAQSLDPDDIAAVENALMYEAGIGGSPGTSKSYNGGMDEFGFWAERYLTTQEASDRFLNGSGSTVTGPGGNSVTPSGPSTTPTTIPHGGTSGQPIVASEGQLYFNTDLFGGTLQSYMSGSFTSVAPGLLEDIPRALINAKGDLIVGATDNDPARLGVGTDGQVLYADSGAPNGLIWDDLPPPGIPEEIIDATGDLIVGLAADTAGRLGVGTDGQVLTARSSETEGVAWEAVPSPGQYQALVYTTDGTDFEFIADGSGEPVYVLRDLE